MYQVSHFDQNLFFSHLRTATEHKTERGACDSFLVHLVALKFHMRIKTDEDSTGLMIRMGLPWWSRG